MHGQATTSSARMSRYFSLRNMNEASELECGMSTYIDLNSALSFYTSQLERTPEYVLSMI
jgi:hypothetical protein